MARMIDGNKLVENLRLIATCWSISPFISKEKHNGAVDMLREVEKEVKEAPTLTQPIIGYCKDCYNWNEQFSAGRKSLNNYVCYCSEWSDPENGYGRYTLPSDYCSYFIPKDGMGNGKTD